MTPKLQVVKPSEMSNELTSLNLCTRERVKEVFFKGGREVDNKNNLHQIWTA